MTTEPTLLPEIKIFSHTEYGEPAWMWACETGDHQYTYCVGGYKTLLAAAHEADHHIRTEHPEASRG